MAVESQFSLNRRTFLGGAAGGLGMISLAHLLGLDTPTAKAEGIATSRTHYPPKAKSVICLFQHGGPSQVDLFDPKKELVKLHGKPYPGDVEAHFEKQKGNCLASDVSARRNRLSKASSSSRLRTRTWQRDKSAPFNSKDGFSVVAPTRVTVPSST